MNASCIIPSLTYHNAASAIEWLCNAFDFTVHLLVSGENDKIVHAELTLGKAMIMLGSTESGTAFSKLVKHPSEMGGIETQSPYIILSEEDIDLHYEKAKAAGAKIIMELKAEDYGGKNYSCYDLEGHLWNFGSYDPWQTMDKSETNNSNRKICEEITKGNVEFYKPYFADDIRWNIVGNGTVRGKKNVIETLGMIALESYPVITIKTIIAEGDKVVIESTGEATTKTGKPYNQSYCDVYHFQDGKIQEFTTYLDTALSKTAERLCPNKS